MIYQVAYFSEWENKEIIEHFTTLDKAEWRACEIENTINYIGSVLIKKLDKN